MDRIEMRRSLLIALMGRYSCVSVYECMNLGFRFQWSRCVLAHKSFGNRAPVCARVLESVRVCACTKKPVSVRVYVSMLNGTKSPSRMWMYDNLSRVSWWVCFSCSMYARRASVCGGAETRCQGIKPHHFQIVIRVDRQHIDDSTSYTHSLATHKSYTFSAHIILVTLRISHRMKSIRPSSHRELHNCDLMKLGFQIRSAVCGTLFLFFYLSHIFHMWIIWELSQTSAQRVSCVCVRVGLFSLSNTHNSFDGWNDAIMVIKWPWNIARIRLKCYCIIFEIAICVQRQKKIFGARNERSLFISATR